MELNLPAGVTEAQWQQALEKYGHPWKPGQRCKGTPIRDCNTERWSCSACHHEYTAFEQIPHDIPMFAVTDELLWQMLVKGTDRDIGFLIHVYQLMDTDHDLSLAAAVILAWASLEVK
jgi:hypothetical protein